jgi:hypothetical protein
MKQHRKDTHVVGVRDPTDAIPHGHIFVTGPTRMPFDKKRKGNHILITRPPSIEPSDCKLLPVLVSKPESMSVVKWNWLCSLPFGVVIFGNPKDHRYNPLPLEIAEGDLDGDLYFICSDNSMLKHIEMTDDLRYLPKKQLTADGEPHSIASSDSFDFLGRAQGKMLDFVRLKYSNELIGKLYTHCIKAAKESEHHWRDQKARHFAKAYKGEFDFMFGGFVYFVLVVGPLSPCFFQHCSPQPLPSPSHQPQKDALKVEKHGGKVPLPSELHEELYKRLWPLLSNGGHGIRAATS